MTGLSVTHLAGDRFELQVRGHRLVCDQPVADGGSDQAQPRPSCRRRPDRLRRLLRRALLAVADRCTVHNSIRQPPDVRITLIEPAGAAAQAAIER